MTVPPPWADIAEGSPVNGNRRAVRPPNGSGWTSSSGATCAPSKDPRHVVTDSRALPTRPARHGSRPHPRRQLPSAQPVSRLARPFRQSDHPPAALRGNLPHETDHDGYQYTRTGCAELRRRRSRVYRAPAVPRTSSPPPPKPARFSPTSRSDTDRQSSPSSPLVHRPRRVGDLRLRLSRRRTPEGRCR